MIRPRDVDAPSIDLRDWFATHCPDSWLLEVMPKNVGSIRDALIMRGMIPRNRKYESPINSYSPEERLALLVRLRWEYADIMLTAREAQS